MTRQMLLLALSAIALTACVHSPIASARYTLTVDYRGVRALGPEPIRMEDRTISLGGSCPDQPDRRNVLQLQLSEPIDGYFYYSCYTSCFMGVGEGSSGKIAPGHPIVLECPDSDLQVALQEG